MPPPAAHRTGRRVARRSRSRLPRAPAEPAGGRTCRFSVTGARRRPGAHPNGQPQDLMVLHAVGRRTSGQHSAEALAIRLRKFRGHSPRVVITAAAVPAPKPPAPTGRCPAPRRPCRASRRDGRCRSCQMWRLHALLDDARAQPPSVPDLVIELKTGPPDEDLDDGRCIPCGPGAVMYNAVVPAVRLLAPGRCRKRSLIVERRPWGATGRTGPRGGAVAGYPTAERGRAVSSIRTIVTSESAQGV